MRSGRISSADESIEYRCRPKHSRCQALDLPSFTPCPHCYYFFFCYSTVNIILKMYLRYILRCIYSIQMKCTKKEFRLTRLCWLAWPSLQAPSSKQFSTLESLQTE